MIYPHNVVLVNDKMQMAYHLRNNEFCEMFHTFLYIIYIQLNFTKYLVRKIEF